MRLRCAEHRAHRAPAPVRAVAAPVVQNQFSRRRLVECRQRVHRGRFHLRRRMRVQNGFEHRRHGVEISAAQRPHRAHAAGSRQLRRERVLPRLPHQRAQHEVPRRFPRRALHRLAVRSQQPGECLVGAGNLQVPRAYQSQAARQPVQVLFLLREFGQCRKPPGDFRRILPPADHRRGLDQQLRVRPVFALRQHHVKERLRGIAHRTQNRDAEPRVARVAMRLFGERPQRARVLPLAQRERGLKTHVRIGVGRERNQPLRKLRRLAQKTLAQFQRVFAYARIGILRGKLHVGSLQRGVSAQQPQRVHARFGRRAGAGHRPQRGDHRIDPAAPAAGGAPSAGASRSDWQADSPARRNSPRPDSVSDCPAAADGWERFDRSARACRL